mmetsp:Transcript_22086/g.61308  ORF Transcript_22086/g.61308 Transcript_22086/m.61308 type:complete len:193 (+) Transcript_22086:210-788(+)|eukprot:CAMPEP_0117667416 /NCGR_PEP_ID=MMETSP0804-20121206/10953_1 /TAXON_ID=1074897 /ORGANISM="Tetraselmis astigmatica, Strain CCMP880" /LENGTH=192 /DNA_ID=CAMNT_0005475137 /DNA_START=117 /DNA_END=695 /DNA_ORIENTATION=-
MAADNEGELFDIVDKNNVVIGQEPRAKVHALGLLHRAVYCFVWNSQGELLIQQRSPKKKIGPGKWDLSCAEHLQPGETFLQGAQRGLLEELNISAAITSGPLAPTHQREHREGESFVDREFVESYCLEGYDGPFTCDPAEVADAKFVTMLELKEMFRERPDDFTPWFRDEIGLLGWLSTPSGAAAEAVVLTS